MFGEINTVFGVVILLSQLFYPIYLNVDYPKNACWFSCQKIQRKRFPVILNISVKSGSSAKNI